jgi:RNA polymerase sigma factor (sigma-70 family)
MSRKVTGSDLLNRWRDFIHAREDMAALFLEYTWQIAWLNTRDDELADEVAQEASYKAVEKAHTFQPHTEILSGAGLPAWLSRVVRNIIIDKMGDGETVYLPKTAYKRWVGDFIAEVLDHRLGIHDSLRQRIQADLSSKTYRGFQGVSYSDSYEKTVLKEIQRAHRAFFSAFTVTEVSIYIAGVEEEDQELEIPGGLEPEKTLMAQISRHCLWPLINSIDHPTRKDLAGRYQVEAALFFIADFNQQEIGERLGLPPEKVRSDFARQIRPQMKKLLESTMFLAKYSACRELLNRHLEENA